MPSFFRRPIVLLAIFLTVFTALLGIGWLHAAPGTGELYLLLGLITDFEQGCRSVHGLAWWTPNYLQGQTLAWIPSMATPLLLEVGRLLFGSTVGYKIIGLLSLIVAGLTMYRFMAEITESEITALCAGAGFALCPEFAIRLAGMEQFVVTTSYPFIPLIFHGLWRLRHRRGGNPRSAILWVAISYSALFFLWAKAAILLLPPLTLYCLWLGWQAGDRSEQRAFRLGLIQAGGFILILAGLPILPLLREQQWMTLFTSDPMAMWQKGFSIKTAFFWWDRGATVLDPHPVALGVTGDAFYIGFIWTAALALVLFKVKIGKTSLRGWLETSEGTLCRLFLALTLLVEWLSYGPTSIWSGHCASLHQAALLPNWSIIFLWLSLVAQVAVVIKLSTTITSRRSILILLPLLYLFTPLFTLIEKIPLYSELRAPAAFWDVSGSFCLVVAGALALAGVIKQWVPPRHHMLAGWVAITLLCADFSIYDRPFWHSPLPDADKLYTEFQESTGYIKRESIPGSVVALSTRYFYLQIPQLTGHPLYTEAGTSFYQLRWTRQFNDGSKDSVEHFKIGLAASGVGFILVDRTDPSFDSSFDKTLRELYPVAFENAGFTIFRCPTLDNPALATGRVSFSPTIPPTQALYDLGFDVWAITPGLDTTEITDPAGPSTAKSTPIPLLQPRNADYQTIRVSPTPPGQPWVIIPESYHPDWTAEADGQAIPVYRALGCYLAAHAPHDGAEITFRFRQPWWYNAVLFISALSWLGALGAIVLIKQRR